MNTYTSFSLYALLISSMLNASHSETPLPAIVYKIFTETQWRELKENLGIDKRSPAGSIKTEGTIFLHTMHSNPYEGRSLELSHSLDAAKKVSDTKKDQHRAIFLTKDQAQSFCDQYTYSRSIQSLIIVALLTKKLDGIGTWQSFSEEPAYRNRNFQFYFEIFAAKDLRLHLHKERPRDDLP